MRAGRPERRRRLACAAGALLWAGFIFWLSAQSDAPGAGLVTLPFEDLLAHAGLYAVLAALLRGAGVPLGATVAAALLYGASDELHQAFVPDRTPALSDLGADLVGALLGAVGVGFLQRGDRAARVE